MFLRDYDTKSMIKIDIAAIKSILWLITKLFFNIVEEIMKGTLQITLSYVLGGSKNPNKYYWIYRNFSSKTTNNKWTNL